MVWATVTVMATAMDALAAVVGMLMMIVALVMSMLATLPCLGAGHDVYVYRVVCMDWETGTAMGVVIAHGTDRVAVDQSTSHVYCLRTYPDH